MKTRFFRLTGLHPSQRHLTDERVFIPRTVCCDTPYTLIVFVDGMLLHDPDERFRRETCELRPDVVGVRDVHGKVTRVRFNKCGCEMRVKRDLQVARRDTLVICVELGREVVIRARMVLDGSIVAV